MPCRFGVADRHRQNTVPVDGRSLVAPRFRRRSAPQSATWQSDGKHGQRAAHHLRLSHPQSTEPSGPRVETDARVGL